MKYDIYSVNEESLAIEVIAGKINSYRNKNISQKGVRLFENNKIYTTSFVGDISDAELVKKAQAAKTVGIPYEHELPKYESFKMEDSESLVDPVHKIQEAIELTQEKLTKFSNEFIFNGKFIRSIYTMSLKDDKGAILEKKFGSNEWHYLYKKVGSPNLMDGYIQEEASKTLDIADVFAKNAPYLEAYNNEIKFQNGKFPVLILESSQLLPKLSESLFADTYCEGSALYSGKLNEKILSDRFSLYDVNYSPKHSLYRKFDDEGVMRKVERLPLIENGVMKNIIANLRLAKKYGVEATGNGTRSFDSAVGVNFNSLVLGAGKRSTQEILKGLDNCIVAFMAHGGDFTDKGDFSTPIQLGYLVKKGEIVGRLPQLTVKTTINEMFNTNLIEIASDSFQKGSIQPSIFAEMDVYVN